MEHVHWAAERPAMHEPVLVTAFEGWSDAGDAASTAARWLTDRWAPEPLATIDCEAFYDFTSTRPMVRLDDGARVIDWPDLELTWGRDAGRDVITLIGHEPHLKWRTFCSEVLEIIDEMNVSFVLSLGALLSDVPHTKPTNTFGTATDQELIDRLGLQRSGYEGPTGIVGVLHDACNQAGVTSASLWAPVSAYVPGAPSPKAALALVRRAAAVLDIGLVTTDLEIATAAYERQVSEVVENDEDMAAYVSELERRYDTERSVPSGDELVAEVERFLREQ